MLLTRRYLDDFSYIQGVKQISNSDYKAVCRYLSEASVIVRKHAANLKEENMARIMSILAKKLNRRNG